MKFNCNFLRFFEGTEMGPIWKWFCAILVFMNLLMLERVHRNRELEQWWIMTNCINWNRNAFNAIHISKLHGCVPIRDKFTDNIHYKHTFFLSDRRINWINDNIQEEFEKLIEFLDSCSQLNKLCYYLKY